MATDATGTPTSLGIPKFNTAVDSPSGLGGNAQMDAIDALIVADRVSLALKAPKPSTTGVKVWDGDSWEDPSGTPTGAKFLRDDGSWQSASTAAIDPATTLPGSPTDGQEAILVDSTTAPTYAWKFQYDSSISDSNKWIFIGGAPVSGGLQTNKTTASFSNLAAFTVPRAGIYRYEAHAGGRISGGVNVNIFKVQVNAVDTVTGESSWINGQVLHHGGITGSLSASQVINLAYQSNGSDLAYVHGSLSVWPVRVA